MVQNFNVVNSAVEDKIKVAENLYQVKKDLKRLKFINDLPEVLERGLNEYLITNDKNDKNIKILEKSLLYYEKCKEFLHIHKENVIYYNIIFLVSC